MPSPFPGMDPYLEEPGIWPDFHLTMTVAMRSELNKHLPDRYVASADRYMWMHDPEAETRILLGRPDVLVSDTSGVASGAKVATAVSAPATIILPGARHKGKPYIKITDRHRRRLVTVIELLSPSNKTPGKDRDSYLMKHDEYLATGVNLVEIDLLRHGERWPTNELSPPAADYYILVCRAWEMPQAGVWPVTVRDPLPSIPIPLDREEVEPLLPLQVCMDSTYDQACYDREVDYAQAPHTPLQEPDATWARDLLAKKPT